MLPNPKHEGNWPGIYCAIIQTVWPGPKLLIATFNCTFAVHWKYRCFIYARLHRTKNTARKVFKYHSFRAWQCWSIQRCVSYWCGKFLNHGDILLVFVNQSIYPSLESRISSSASWIHFNHRSLAIWWNALSTMYDLVKVVMQNLNFLCKHSGLGGFYWDLCGSCPLSLTG